MRIHAGHATLFGRVVLGGYLAVHGAQKLFGSFNGHGLEATTAGFGHLGLTPAREMATLAGAAELGGGILTAAGVAHPLGPVALAGAMTVASATHRSNGPLAANGGYELPLTNLALAAVLAAVGPTGFRLPRRLAFIVTAGAATLTAIALGKLLTHRQPVTPEAPAQPAESDGPMLETV